jgi:hypothetical protein
MMTLSEPMADRGKRKKEWPVKGLLQGQKM